MLCFPRELTLIFIGIGFLTIVVTQESTLPSGGGAAPLEELFLLLILELKVFFIVLALPKLKLPPALIALAEGGLPPSSVDAYSAARAKLKFLTLSVFHTDVLNSD